MTKKIVLVITDQNGDGDVRVDFGEGTTENISIMDVLGTMAFLDSVVYENVLENSGDAQAAFEQTKQLNELALRIIEKNVSEDFDGPSDDKKDET